MLYLLLVVIGGGMILVGALGVLFATGLWLPLLVLFIMLPLINVFSKPSPPPPSVGSRKPPRKRNWWDE